MKIMFACPGLENPTCGIGNYTKQFAIAAASLGQDVVCYGGPLAGLYDRILEWSPEVVHIQFEYGWASPERLQIIATQCEALGIKLVVTFHSVSPCAPHNWAISNTKTMIVVHSDVQPAFFWSENVRHIPLAIPYCAPAADAITAPKQPGVPRLGWFGNVFFHKGLHQLLRDVGENTEVLVLGGKPPHSVGYFERCQELAKQSKARVMWYDKYLPDAHVVAHLKTCDSIYFPYEEYGGTGCSAALRLAFNAEVPCIVSNSSHFKDVLARNPPCVALYGPYLKPSDQELVDAANDLRNQWSFENIVAQHLYKVYE